MLQSCLRMQRVAKPVLACVLGAILYACAAQAYAAPLINPVDFMRLRNIPENLANAMLSANGPLNKCENTNKQLICVQGKLYPGVGKNAVARQGVLKNLELSVLQQLRLALAQAIPSGLYNISVTGEALASPGAKDALKGLEFINYCRSDWCGAIATVPLNEVKRELPQVYVRPEFVRDYCKLLLPIARKDFDRGDYKKALVALKELHDLKFANAEAYLLAVKAFTHENQTDDAKKIAREILEDLSDQMTAEQAEDLGNAFLEWNMEDNAIRSYQLASSKLQRE